MVPAKCGSNKHAERIVDVHEVSNVCGAEHGLGNATSENNGGADRSEHEEQMVDGDREREVSCWPVVSLSRHVVPSVQEYLRVIVRRTPITRTCQIFNPVNPNDLEIIGWRFQVRDFVNNFRDGALFGLLPILSFSPKCWDLIVLPSRELSIIVGFVYSQQRRVERIMDSSLFEVIG